MIIATIPSTKPKCSSLAMVRLVPSSLYLNTNNNNIIILISIAICRHRMNSRKWTCNIILHINSSSIKHNNFTHPNNSTNHLNNSTQDSHHKYFRISLLIINLGNQCNNSVNTLNKISNRNLWWCKKSKSIQKKYSITTNSLLLRFSKFRCNNKS